MKTALISGGAARIGAQIVRTLNENGYKVIIHCHQSEEIAQALCHELNSKRNNSAQVIVADLGDNEAIKKLTQKIKSLDLLVNNASVFYPTSTENSTIEDWEKIMILDRIPLKRQGSPNDIAEAVLFLANSKYITGQIINIDGGRSLNQ